MFCLASFFLVSSKGIFAVIVEIQTIMQIKRKLLLNTGIFLFLLIAVRIVWIFVFMPPQQPDAIRGQLDLRGMDLTQTHALKLDGEWEFYPNALIKEAKRDTDTSGIDDAFIQVPGDWKKSLSVEGRSSNGFGTYHLRVLVDPREGQTYGMRLLNIPSAFTLYVNGKLLAQSGQPGQNDTDYIARNVPYSAAFMEDGAQIDIIIQASNFETAHVGGIHSSITFGTQQAVSYETRLAIILQLMVCTTFLLHAVYAFILYLMGVRQRVLLFFAGAIIFSALWVLVSDDMLLLVWLPLHYDWIVKIQLLTFLGAAVFMLEFTKRLLTEYLHVTLFRWYSIIGAIVAVYTLLAPVQYVQPAFGGIIGFVLLSYFIVPIITLRTAMKSDTDAVALVLGATALANNIIWGIVKDAGWVDIFYYPVDLVVSFLAFVSYWFKRYIYTYAQTDKLSKELQRADKQKDDFLANTSHELRNPLHGMLNMTQIVLDSDKHSLSENNVKNLELILTVGRRMSFMLNDLIDLTLLKEDNVRLHVKSLQVQTVVSGVIDMLRYMLEGKPIQLNNTLADNFPPVMADEDRLIQILFNLLHNAIKFTNDGDITISGYVQDMKAYISMEDTGIGMDEETRQRIFEPYEQGDSSLTASPGGGIGLGLSICRQLVELHDGTLEAVSFLGQGSKFTFTLPLASLSVQTKAEFKSPVYAETAAASAAVSPVFESVATVRKEKPALLVVDDDTLNLKILGHILDSESFEIAAVTSGKEALAQLETRDWDLVITDIMMPHMSGYELTRIIRERFSISELPILLLTARNRPEDIAAGFQSGANDYVTKPADATELKTRVNALINLNRSVNARLLMEAAWLQAQIKPHFLFNSLNSIAALSEIDLSKMHLLLNEFSNYLRSSFDFKNSDRLVLIDRELEFVRSYLYIEKQRFEHRLEVVWEIDADLNLEIPPLSIQPLVENAVRHGIMSRSKGGKITIGIKNQQDRAEITVADNGSGMDEETVQRIFERQLDGRQGIGLLNVDRRLKQMYGQGLRIHSQPGLGTVVSFLVLK
ncbi:hypothetical protein GCM10008018_54630 [Paenibacillus marchantiophytorum]|uniref:histidine kinase n=1 Tax=Paenibacillus marchantiophytorum TaxID=1619310 RepID=A0ABQ1F7A5_9BACL|nr:hypothetical protein GCM10008018_54630 [Paenibacillus marchantiophytorum]